MINVMTVSFWDVTIQSFKVTQGSSARVSIDVMTASFALQWIGHLRRYKEAIHDSVNVMTATFRLLQSRHPKRYKETYNASSVALSLTL